MPCQASHVTQFFSPIITFSFAKSKPSTILNEIVLSPRLSVSVIPPSKLFSKKISGALKFSPQNRISDRINQVGYNL